MICGSTGSVDGYFGGLRSIGRGDRRAVVESTLVRGEWVLIAVVTVAAFAGPVTLTLMENTL